MSAATERVSKCVVTAVDVGERNFACVTWSAEKGYHDFIVMDLKAVKGDAATKMRTLQDRGLFDTCTALLVERQMRSKFKEMATSLRCFNWGKTTLVAPQSVKRVFGTTTKKHATNKRAHVQLAQRLLTAQEARRLNSYKKKDDLADCVAMIAWYRQTRLQHDNVLPRKPSRAGDFE